MPVLFLCGDVMTGRGIDQILPQPSDPRLFEPYVTDAREYVALAESMHGAIPRAAAWPYIWGDALAVLEARHPQARIVNLETSVTTSDRPADKGIHYRMHPQNVGCLTAAGLDCCVLANNHVLDWGRAGLDETLASLQGAGLATAGAGHDLAAADAPAVVPLDGGGRLLIFASATGDSGVPRDWAAGPEASGVSRLPDLSARTLQGLRARIEAHRRAGDLVMCSIHWGENWGFRVPPEQRAWAHALVDEAGVDLIHGHSSHHVRGLEVHAGRLILYGCGDLLTDYEGIGGHERYRGDLSFLYFPQLDPRTGELIELELVPTRMRRFRLEHADGVDRAWLAETIQAESARLDPAITFEGTEVLKLRP